MTKGKSGFGFDIDLSQALIREESIRQIFMNASIELKTDYLAKDTGNVFVEFKQHGKPSGLAVTTASYWMFEIQDFCYILIETKNLNDIARRAFIAGKRTKGGDYNNYEGVLIPVSWLTGMA